LFSTSHPVERPMLETARILGVNQLARQEVTVKRLPESTPRETALEGFRRRNAFLDGLFYDVGKITAEEAQLISPWLAAEGAILIVPPAEEGQLTLCTSVDDFIAKGGANIPALAIAGVGSSALGSAAFARNIADGIGSPVAVVVSGYGLADLVTEALGGYFLFGQLNGLRHMFEHLDAAGMRFGTVPDISVARTIRKSRDTAAVVALLKNRKLKFKLLTGHSKGNLVLSEALYELYEEDRPRLKQIADATRIVTVSAVIGMPPVFRGIIDVIGAWDWFGGINSRPDIKPEVVVPCAWHHTNTELPAHLPVTAVFKAQIDAGLLA
jgi:hypothetical protein